MDEELTWEELLYYSNLYYEDERRKEEELKKDESNKMRQMWKHIRIQLLYDNKSCKEC